MNDDRSTLDSLNLKIVQIQNNVEVVKTKQEETRKWQVFILILAPLTTAILGCLVWFWQSRIQQQIDERTRELTTRLALTEEFYRRKLTIYEKVHQQMADLTNALDDVQFNPASRKVATDKLHALYLSYTTNTLYLSDDLTQQLAKLWDLGTHISVLDSSGKSTMLDIGKQVSTIEEQMKKDLRLGELERFPGH